METVEPPAREAGQEGVRGAARGAAPAAVPVLLHRRDSLLPATAAALAVRGETSTLASVKNDELPALHPLVADFLAGLPISARERFTGRCPEAVLLSQYLAGVEQGRRRRQAGKPFREQDARKALRGARMTVVRIREEGDPEHGSPQPPCRSCAPLLEHFGVKSVTVRPARKPRG